MPVALVLAAKRRAHAKQMTTPAFKVKNIAPAIGLPFVELNIVNSLNSKQGNAVLALGFGFKPRAP